MLLIFLTLNLGMGGYISRLHFFVYSFQEAHGLMGDVIIEFVHLLIVVNKKVVCLEG